MCLHIYLYVIFCWLSWAARIAFEFHLILPDTLMRYDSDTQLHLSSFAQRDNNNEQISGFDMLKMWLRAIHSIVVSMVVREIQWRTRTLHTKIHLSLFHFYRMIIDWFPIEIKKSNE